MRNTGTVRLHRILRAPAERIYRAFLEPAALVKWLPPHGHTATVHALDARVGGSFRISFGNLGTGTGTGETFGGTYLELVPGALIRHTDVFDNPDLPGEMMVTVRLRAVACGTELDIVQDGIPEQIPVAFCHLGWQESLTLLALLVEAEIPASP
jgi:uncharacterized protein YndB with AHSA1/START domain